MKCFTRCSLVLSSVFVVGAIALGACAWFAASWLNAGDPPIKAERMLILSGDPLRAIYAAELYRNGFAKEIYLTRSLRSPRYQMYEDMGITFPLLEDVSRAILLKKGVADRDIHFIGGQPVLSTADEVYAARQFFMKSGGGRLLIVTSPFHVRRAKVIFHDAMPESSISVVATPYDRIPEKWWTDQAASRLVVLECAKIVYYALGGRFTSRIEGQIP